jgi:hypothetical protein
MEMQNRTPEEAELDKIRYQVFFDLNQKKLL